MKKEEFFEVMEDIEDKYLEEARGTKPVKSTSGWTKWVAVVACFCIVFAGVVGIQNSLSKNVEDIITGVPAIIDGDPNTDMADKPGTNDPSVDKVYKYYTDDIVLPESGADAYDMIGCLVYKGSVYTQGAVIINDSKTWEALKGDYIGDAIGSLEEWSTKEDYAKEFASTYSGKVYTVKGYSEDFRLMIEMDTEEGARYEMVENFDNIGVTYGKDLFDERFHIWGNVKDVTYLTHDEWNNYTYGDNLVKRPEHVSDDQWDKFFDTLMNSEFEHVDYKENPEFYSTPKQGHLYLTMNDDTMIEIRLVDGGYVGYQGLGWIYVKMPGEIFDTVLNACQ